jgi:tryptophan 2,3-dioxygenase
MLARWRAQHARAAPRMNIDTQSGGGSSGVGIA